ncbi:MAG: shikimate dehydrogenase [Thermodesulfobacteriaceae bacterium]|nr:shikimate dehydrogenase [Thermodesulfobacteriaceae bacterium]
MYKVFGIIGDPVDHSLSPTMHNIAFKELGIKAVYGAFLVKPENLAKAIEGIKALNIKGVSVTIPHKEAIVSYLDEIDQVALKIGAVNTILNENGVLKGYNTDWIGVIKAFEEKGVQLKGKRVVILGAGGASRAIIYALKESGAEKITLYNRTYAKAEKLASLFQISAYPWEDLPKAEGDILIQATSVGLKSFHSPISEEILKRFKIAMDTVYIPLRTKFLSLAEKFVDITIDGLKMLLYQGVEQFKLFTGREAPIIIMEKVLYEEAKRLEEELNLGKEEC